MGKELNKPINGHEKEALRLEGHNSYLVVAVVLVFLRVLLGFESGSKDSDPVTGGEVFRSESEAFGETSKASLGSV